MARSIQEIYDAIIAEKETLTSLDGLTPNPETAAGLLAALTSSSKVAIWRLWAWVVAYAHYLLEVEYDAHVVEVTTLANAQKYGSLPWYVSQAKVYQEGYTLVLVNDFYQYATVDEAARLVSQAAASEAGSTVLVKVAKDVGGAPGALTPTELAAFDGYMQQIKPAGVDLQCVSLNADELRVSIVIGYDPTLTPATVQAGVEGAIDAYVSALPFDGRFRRLAFEDAIQAVQGVRTISVNSIEGVSGSVLAAISEEYITAAGYMTYDDANSTITMQAYA